MFLIFLSLLDFLLGIQNLNNFAFVIEVLIREKLHQNQELNILRSFKPKTTISQSLEFYGTKILNINAFNLQMNIKFGKMDMERPLKFQGQCFHIETDSDFNECFNQNFLYDPLNPCEQYSNQNTGCETSSNLIQRLKSSVDIVFTPMHDLISLAQKDFEYKLFNQGQLKRSLRKTKLIQKRQRAKNRHKMIPRIEIIPVQSSQVVSVERNQDIKKQKNRLSAQISRDKKKQYYTKLQIENQELKATINQLNKTHQQLLKKMNRQNQEPKKKSQKGDNIFKSLLIFLGIIFLINLIKSTPGLRTQKSSQRFPISKLELNKHEKNFVTEQMRSYGVELSLQLIQKSKNQVYINKNLANKIMQVRPTLF